MLFRSGYFPGQQDSVPLLGDACSVPAGGCWIGDEAAVHAVTAFEFHELAHAAQGLVRPNGDRSFLDEGFSGAVDPFRRVRSARALSGGEVWAGIARGKNPDHDFLVDELGTNFASYLLASHGVAPLWALSQQLTSKSLKTFAAFDQAFTGLVGESVDALLSRRALIPRVPGYSERYAFSPVGFCGAHTPRLELGNQRLELPGPASCDDPLAQGTVDARGNSTLWATVLVTIAPRADDPVFDPAVRETWPARLVYDNRIGSEDSYRAYSTWLCTDHDGPMPLRPWGSNAEGLSVLPLQPGTHVVFVSAQSFPNSAIPVGGFIERTSQSNHALSQVDDWQSGRPKDKRKPGAAEPVTMAGTR